MGIRALMGAWPVLRQLRKNRGATAEVVKVGKTVAAYGYPSTVEKDEMRAERQFAERLGRGDDDQRSDLGLEIVETVAID